MSNQDFSEQAEAYTTAKAPYRQLLGKAVEGNLAQASGNAAAKAETSAPSVDDPSKQVTGNKDDSIVDVAILLDLDEDDLDSTDGEEDEAADEAKADDVPAATEKLRQLRLAAEQGTDARAKERWQKADALLGNRKPRK